MGTILDLPTDPRRQKGRQQWERGHNWETVYHQTETMRNENYLLSRTPMILPFNSFEIRPERVEETAVKSPHPSSQTTTPRRPDTEVALDTSPISLSHDPSGLETETRRLNSTPSSMFDEGGSHRHRHHYIKRYRNEEEKLMDIVREREKTLREAVRRGQQLRAKCNRYRDELQNVKAMLNIQMTDTQWKRKYFEMDKKYRDVKERLDVAEARNKNGRDFLDQQKETIDILNIELQREKIDKQRVMSSSLSSLHSVGVKDKKGKVAIAKLKTEKKHLEDHVNDLIARNKRGRGYLAKLEAENREHGAMIAKLKAQLLQERAEKENLLAKFGSRAGSSASNAGRDIDHAEGPLTSELYATVQRVDTFTDENLESDSLVHAGGTHEAHDTRSTGFELEDHDQREGIHTYKMGKSYEEINFSVGMAKVARDNVSEEEVIIEAVLEPESDDSDYDEGHRNHASKDDDARDEMKGGQSPERNRYEPKRDFNGETITRF